MPKKVDWNARAKVFTDMAARYRAVPHNKEHHELMAQGADREAARLAAKAKN